MANSICISSEPISGMETYHNLILFYIAIALQNSVELLQERTASENDGGIVELYLPEDVLKPAANETASERAVGVQVRVQDPDSRKHRCELAEGSELSKSSKFVLKQQQVLI